MPSSPRPACRLLGLSCSEHQHFVGCCRPFSQVFQRTATGAFDHLVVIHATGIHTGATEANLTAHHAHHVSRVVVTLRHHNKTKVSMFTKAMHRQVLILAVAQALFQIVSVMVMTIGGLAGAQIAESPSWATLPIAAMFCGTAVLTFPASLMMDRIGRRLGFQCGALLGVTGGLVAAFGVHQASLPLLSFGTFLVGGYQAFAQFYRFAASEVADSSFRPRAISLVMAGGVVAALAGPLLARLGGPLYQPEYLGSFLILAVVSMVAAGALIKLQVPQPAARSSTADQGRPWQQIVSQPSYMVALFGAATGYGIMILAMTATPIAMVHHHHGLGTAATVIQLHVLGMFLPSFFTGSLIARFGVLRIMLTGLALPPVPI